MSSPLFRQAALTPPDRTRTCFRLTPRDSLEYGLRQASNYVIRNGLMAGSTLKGLPELSSIDRGGRPRVVAIKGVRSPADQIGIDPGRP